MNFDSETVADKLKIIRLGKQNKIPFTHDGEEFVGRPLDWIEGMQVDAETKAALHVDRINRDNPDQFCYRMLATLNKGILVHKIEGDKPSWIEKSQDSDKGLEFLRGLYTAYCDAVYPKVAEPAKKESGTSESK